MAQAMTPATQDVNQQRKIAVKIKVRHDCAKNRKACTTTGKHSSLEFDGEWCQPRERHDSSTVHEVKSGDESCCTKWHRQGRMPSKVLGVMGKAGWLMLLFSMALAAAAQQKNPMDNKACKQDPWRCGVVVTFDPPFDGAAGVLLVPNKVTVDVPLELQPTEVRVTTYPLGTEVVRPTLRRPRGNVSLSENRQLRTVPGRG